MANEWVSGDFIRFLGNAFGAASMGKKCIRNVRQNSCDTDAHDLFRVTDSTLTIMRQEVKSNTGDC